MAHLPLHLCVCFQDRALPIAVKTGSVYSQLRLCNKLSELLLQMRVCEEAVEFAQTALDLSVSLGMIKHVYSYASKNAVGGSIHFEWAFPNIRRSVWALSPPRTGNIFYARRRVAVR